MRLFDADALDTKVEQHYKHKIITRYDRDLLLHYLDVEMAPTVEPMRWIPVTERLPEELTKVLACRKNGSIEIMFFNPALTTRYPKGFSIIKNNFSWRQDNVIAWMPLPKPWRGEANELV